MPRKKTTEEFIKEAISIHGNRYDYSLVKYEGNRNKVRIICPIHGEFQQAPFNHTSQKQGCPKCGMERLSENMKHPLDYFLKKAHEKFGNFFDYSKVEYDDYRTNVVIICPEHGDFIQTPYDHIRTTHGCPQCAKRARGLLRRGNTNDFITKAKIVHGDFYDYSKVDYTVSNKKVEIVCPIHGSFHMFTYVHLQGDGCPRCKENSRFISKAKQVYGELYSYDKVDYKNCNTLVTIICREHGEFRKNPTSFLAGAGCQICSMLQRADNHRLTLDEFIRRANYVHHSKYDYTKVEYITGDTKVEIICPKHGPFFQTPYMHYSGQGCPKCGREAVSEKRRRSTEDFIEIVTEIHRNKYDYSKLVYTGSGNKVTIICPIHGEFEQIANDHIHGCGCRKCAAVEGGVKGRKTQEEFLQEAKAVHGDKYDYSNSLYDGIDTPLEIVCKIHGPFMQTPYTHISGSGCPICSNFKRALESRKTQEQFINEVKALYGDKYDYSLIDYVISTEPVCLICPEHGEFWKTPASLLSGGGCQKCSAINSAESRRKDTAEFIQDAVRIHGDVYDYSLVNYISSETPIEIICSKHGLFSQTPSSHLSGHGCQKCAADRISESKRKNTEQFIAEAKLIHGDKYDYSFVEYQGSNEKVTIICPKHGEFFQAAGSHIMGYGCNKCAIEKRTDLQRGTLEEFVLMSNITHNGKYDYSKVVYSNIGTPVEINCPIHGPFFQTPYNHRTGQGCPKCSKEARRKSQELVIKDFIEVHGDKYDYSKVDYQGTKYKIEVICPTHGSFWTRPDQHAIGSGCPQCSNEENESRLERKVRLLLERNNIPFQQQMSFPWLTDKGRMYLDFYLPSYKIVIECQGLQHFEAVDYYGGEQFLKEYQHRDSRKKELCEQHGLKVLYYSNLKIKYPYEVILDTADLLQTIQNGGKVKYYRQLTIKF